MQEEYTLQMKDIFFLINNFGLLINILMNSIGSVVKPHV